MSVGISRWCQDDDRSGSPPVYAIAPAIRNRPLDFARSRGQTGHGAEDDGHAARRRLHRRSECRLHGQPHRGGERVREDGSAAKAALPALAPLATHTDPKLSAAATAAIKAIGK